MMPQYHKAKLLAKPNNAIKKRSVFSYFAQRTLALACKASTFEPKASVRKKEQMYFYCVHGELEYHVLKLLYPCWQIGGLCSSIIFLEGMRHTFATSKNASPAVPNNFPCP